MIEVEVDMKGSVSEIGEGTSFSLIIHPVAKWANIKTKGGYM